MAQSMSRLSASKSQRSFCLISIYFSFIFSSIILGSNPVMADSNPNIVDDIDSSNSTPVLIPYPGYNIEPETELVIDEFGNYVGPTIDELASAFYNFHIIKIRFLSQNNRTIDLFVEESINEESCKRRNTQSSYSPDPSMYLLRTSKIDVNNESNGYAIFWYTTNGSIATSIRLYGEFFNGSNSEGWSIHISGNSSNQSSVKVIQLGIIGPHKFYQTLNNSIADISRYSNWYHVTELQTYRIVRIRMVYDQFEFIKMCEIVLSAENILRHQLKIQLVVERFEMLTQYHMLLNPSEHDDCSNEDLLNSLSSIRPRIYKVWNSTNYYGNLRGDFSPKHFREGESLVYIGSKNDTLISYPHIVGGNATEPERLSCASQPEGGPDSPIGVGWALLDHVDSTHWNSVNMFTRMLGIMMGAKEENSTVGNYAGFSNGPGCLANHSSLNLYHSLSYNPWRNSNSSKNYSSQQSLGEECYGAIPQFNPHNIIQISNATSQLPFNHTQPDWSNHNHDRVSSLFVMKLRIFYLQSLNVLGNSNYSTGIQGNQSSPNWTINGGDPIWRIYWTMEPTIWSNSNNIMPGPATGTYSLLEWYNGIRELNGTQSVSHDSWLGYCRLQLNIQHGTILSYRNGGYTYPLVTVHSNNMIQCNNRLSYGIYSPSSQEYSPNDLNNSNKTSSFWTIFPAATMYHPVLSSPFLLRIDYQDVAISWYQLS